ncbi:hypothetical protein HDU97_000820 [Phlyctochytrium planicorne]|nr:hypothetical protein HDU97_000820 [Phlyctochytrium planicorne]
MSDLKITFIGGGNMAGSMIGGLISRGFNPSNIHVSEPVEALRQKLSNLYKVNVTTDNAASITSQSVIVLAVKPQVLKGVAEGIAAAVQKHEPLIISIAAGIRVGDLARWLAIGKEGFKASIVRVMPNTPALVLEGASGLWAGPEVSQKQRDVATGLVASFSAKSFWVEKESLLDVVTGVSGSGPAYFFYLLEAMENAGVQLGLPRDVARGLAAQTCLGAGKMAVAELEDPAILRRNVTSPNGTTAAAIKTFDDAGSLKVMVDAVVAATHRGGELADILGKQGSSGAKI